MCISSQFLVIWFLIPGSSGGEISRHCGSTCPETITRTRMAYLTVLNRGDSQYQMIWFKDFNLSRPIPTGVSLFVPTQETNDRPKQSYRITLNQEQASQSKDQHCSLAYCTAQNGSISSLSWMGIFVEISQQHIRRISGINTLCTYSAIEFHLGANSPTILEAPKWISTHASTTTTVTE